MCVCRTSLSSYSHQGSLSDDSGISVSSGRNAVGRERSETPESSSGWCSRVRDTSKTTTTTLGRRFGASSSTLSGISVTEMFNKYSPSNYTRAYSADSTDSIYSRSHSSSALVGRHSVGSGGAVGGCSLPSVEHRSRLNSEVILQFNNNTNNNQVTYEEASSEDDNGNKLRLSVAEIRRRFDSSLPAAVPQQNDSRIRGYPIRSSPSPVLARKIYSSKSEGRLSSSEDEDDEEQKEDEDNQQAEESDTTSRHSPVCRVAGGATPVTISTTHSESPKPQPAEAVSSVNLCLSLGGCMHGFLILV